MEVLGLIPARGGSKGIPGKNIKPLAGKPLIAYTIEQALQARSLSTVMVSTDDERIARVARDHGAEVPFLRRAELARDETPTIEVVLDVIETYLNQGFHFDMVCLLQPTSPLRPAELIEKAVEKFVQSGADSLITVRSVPHEFNPHWQFEPDRSGQFLRIVTGEDTIIARRQELPPTYHRDGSLYLVRTDVLKKFRSLYGKKIAHLITDELPHVNLDTMRDWDRAENLLRKQGVAGRTGSESL